MDISLNGINFIKNWEGFRPDAYYCANGKLTIGYGHTGPDVKKGMRITPETALKLLDADLVNAERAVNQSVKVSLTQNQFDVLVSFTFNCGVDALKTSTLLKELNKGHYDAVPGQLKLWVHDDHGGVIQGLVNRRNAEIALWKNNKPQTATPAKPPAPPTGESLNAKIKEQLEIIHAAQSEIRRLLG